MIEIKSLRIDYEGVTAVDDLSLEIPQGQIFGLVGPNGAGKTSTIKALAGVLEPTYGNIKILGYDLTEKREGALHVLGYMPDFPPVYDNLRVWEYLDIFAAAYDVPYRERSVTIRQWLNRVQLENKSDAFIRDLSRGMRQRLVLAKTLLHEPQVLLLDEPASGLDPLARHEMRSILTSFSQKDKTILISSHILSELSDFCNAIGIMEKGKLIISGSLAEIREKLQIKKKIIITTSDNYLEFKQDIINFVNEHEKLHNYEGVNNNKFILTFSGTDQEASEILNEMIEGGMKISNFQIKEDDIEDIFFKIGAKEVS